MRLALKLINRSLGLNWGYVPVASFDKSLFYQNLFYTLRKSPSLSTTNLSLIRDPRNLSAKWLAFKSPLTLLASTEKKTISGFDVRLASLKGPAKIKASRRRGAFLYADVSANKTPAFGGLNPLTPFISQSKGWGVRSSKADSYLRNGRFLGFKKPPLGGFFGINSLPKSILAPYKEALLTEGGLITTPLSANAIFLVSSDLSQGASLLAGKTFSEGKAENPNIAPKSQSTQADLSTLSKDWDEYLFWATGITPSFGFFIAQSFLSLTKSQMAKKVVAFYI